MIKGSFKFKQTKEGDYLSIQDETIRGRYSEVRGGSFSVEVPMDNKTGMPVSSRQYSPLDVIKFIDSSSPTIFSGVVKGTKFAEAVITLYRYNSDKGEEEAYYRLVLENVTFIKQKELFSEGVVNQGEENPPMELVSLVAEKITKTFIDGHISHADEYKAKGA